jgi:hypothetical protein
MLIFHDPGAIVASLLIFAVCASVMLLIFSNPLLRWAFSRRSTNTHGTFVAEVWLNWEICPHGSTMYRQRFSSKWRAAIAVKLHAMALDWILPKYYRGEDYYGHPCSYKHEYGILFGIRQLEPNEAANFHVIWTTTMPGYDGFEGEHVCAHPLLDRNYDKDLKDMADLGFKF